MADKTDIDKLTALNRIAHAVEAMAKKQDPDFVPWLEKQRKEVITKAGGGGSGGSGAWGR